jgi:hypothetical protein
MTQIFISYSRKDIAFIRRLAADLERASYTVWWDITDLRGGDDWVRVIPEAIETSDFVIVVLSPDATASEWVRKEYTQALSLRKRIIPIMLRMTAVPFALNTINYVDFTSESAYAENLNALLQALGYTGELPVLPATSWPLTLRSLMIPIVVSILILLVLGAFYVFNPPVPSSTPTLTNSPVPTLTEVVFPTFTPLPDTPTVTDTSSPTATATITATSTPTDIPTATSTPTATATIEVLESLPFCVSKKLSDVSAVNVRQGPGIEYPTFEDALRVGKCLTFWAVSEDGMWMLIANDQADPEMQKFEGGWIRRDLLVPGVSGGVSLPVWTLTPTPTPSDTPTVTPTSTPSFTPTLTPTDTATPTETETPTPS